jgi:hypothetical protein
MSWRAALPRAVKLFPAADWFAERGTCVPSVCDKTNIYRKGALTFFCRVLSTYIFIRGRPSISARRQSSRRRWQSSERIHLTFDYANVGIIDMSISGHIFTEIGLGDKCKWVYLTFNH